MRASLPPLPPAPHPRSRLGGGTSPPRSHKGSGLRPTPAPQGASWGWKAEVGSLCAGARQDVCARALARAPAAHATPSRISGSLLGFFSQPTPPHAAPECTQDAPSPGPRQGSMEGGANSQGCPRDPITSTPVCASARTGAWGMLAGRPLLAFKWWPHTDPAQGSTSTNLPRLCSRRLPPRVSHLD